MTLTVGSALAGAIAASSRSAWLRLRMPPPTTPTSTSAAAPPASKRRRCGERSGMNGLQFERVGLGRALAMGDAEPRGDEEQDRKSVVEGKSVSVRVDLGGRSIIKKKTRIKTSERILIRQ